MSVLVKLYNILDELENHRRHPSKVLEDCISERLNNSLKTYMHSIDNSYDYLESRDGLNVMKKMNRSYEESN